MVTIPRIETPRLLLREWRDSDIDAYAALCADPEVMRYLAMNQTLSREDAWRQMAAFAGHWMLRGFGLWVAELRETGELAGRIGCHQPEGWPGFEIGWTLRREFWGRGLAAEGARAAMRFAFETMGRDHVISVIHPDNRRSIALAERLGEQLEGRTRVRDIDVLIYGIDRARWRTTSGEATAPR